MKFATKTYIVSHHTLIMYTLPWEVKSPNLLKIKKDTTHKSYRTW